MLCADIAHGGFYCTNACLIAGPYIQLAIGIIWHNICALASMNYANVHRYPWDSAIESLQFLDLGGQFKDSVASQVWFHTCMGCTPPDFEFIAPAAFAR